MPVHEVADDVAELVRGEAELLVVLGLHEVVVVAVAVQELDGPLLEMARGHFSPAWKVRSTVWPRLTLRSLIRTWAEPRPILMWW